MTFHWYGFIVGLAVSVVIWGLDHQFDRSKSSSKVAVSTWQLAVLLTAMLVGARLWHVVSDWHMYGHLSWQLVAVWQGGLSILGALLAGVATVWWLIPAKAQRVWLFDALVLWLPIGQAVGRLANWVNQELYGLPTTLPWGVSIDIQHRLPGFESYGLYHPLFAYEAIGLLLLAGLLRWLHNKQAWSIGQGKLGLAYLQGYIWLRYWLDFLRIDRSHEWFGLGFNQVILILVGGGILGWLVYKNRAARFAQQWLIGVGLVSALFIFGSITVIKQQASWLQVGSDNAEIKGQAIMRSLLMVPDKSLQQIIRNDLLLSVVVVNTNASRQQGLSDTTQLPADGMLFVFDRPDRHVFWMKDMQYPLDFIWFRDGKVVDLETDVPIPAKLTDVSQLPRYAPKQPADMMLEVAAGTIQTNNWQIGDSIQYLPNSPSLH